jgi:signal transduction histidine kinase
MVEDNGKGFNYAPTDKNGMGLKHIRKRVSDMKGTFIVDSNFKRGGCTISIEIPLT